MCGSDRGTKSPLLAGNSVENVSAMDALLRPVKKPQRAGLAWSTEAERGHKAELKVPSKNFAVGLEIRCPGGAYPAGPLKSPSTIVLAGTDSAIV